MEAFGFWGWITISLRSEAQDPRDSRRRGEFVLRPQNARFRICSTVRAEVSKPYPVRPEVSVSDPNNLPAVLGPAGVELKPVSLRQSLALFRPALRSSAHTQRALRGRDRNRIRDQVFLTPATTLIAACARFAWATGQKHVQKPRAAWFLGRIIISL